ncbi:class I lanthipeptide [Pedobacter sp. AW1-32]|uniref:class I lanthipeptide n=1 Tax=Pedobacter sp. AW1-32 TaxID=3383026 RepID=UPI003FED43C5
MKPVKNNKLNIDRKTIAKLDQSAMASLNGGGAAADSQLGQGESSDTFWTLTSLVPTIEPSTTITATLIR